MDWQFWNNPAAWPGDTDDYIFLARAFCQVGRATFPVWDHAWDDQAVPISVESASTDNEDEQDRLFDEACAEFDEMLATVAREIIAESQRGNLVTALRPIPGGEITEIPTGLWNSEHLLVRFDLCRMSLTSPFASDGFAAFGSSWIYISRKSLDAYLRREHPSRSVQKHNDELRPRSPRGYNIADAPLILEMHQRIAEGKAKSADDAARQLAHEAKGQSLESKSTRLAKRYRAEFSAGRLESLIEPLRKTPIKSDDSE